jgi:hypothetical protein
MILRWPVPSFAALPPLYCGASKVRTNMDYEYWPFYFAARPSYDSSHHMSTHVMLRSLTMQWSVIILFGCLIMVVLVVARTHAQATRTRKHARAHARTHTCKHAHRRRHKRTPQRRLHRNAPGTTRGHAACSARVSFACAARTQQRLLSGACGHPRRSVGAAGSRTYIYI